MAESYPKPSGTIAVLIIYAALSLILWGSIYLTLLFRGATQ